jgi:hypothetical protein
MSAPSEPQIIADTGGLLVTDDGRRVLVIDRCTGALTTFAFVLGVITLAVGGFGLAALIADMPSRAIGAAFLAVGLVFAVLTLFVLRKIRARRNQPLHDCRQVGVIDRKLGLFSYRGGALVQLDQVRFARGSRSVRVHRSSSRSRRAGHESSSAATRSTVASVTSTRC